MTVLVVSSNRRCNSANRGGRTSNPVESRYTVKIPFVGVSNTPAAQFASWISADYSRSNLVRNGGLRPPLDFKVWEVVL